MNFQGYAYGENGIAHRSIYNTMLEAGFYLDHHSGVKKGDDVETTDIIYLASMKPFNFKKLSRSRMNNCCVPFLHHFSDYPLELDHPAFENGYVLRDDKPILDMLNQGMIYSWRVDLIQSNVFDGNGYKSITFL
ncbi:MAG: hypothetical protein HRT72_13985 [Flavobacteriales bacterium]|nr:hypothetical protein [Flavobacteriales bacterium]